MLAGLRPDGWALQLRRTARERWLKHVTNYARGYHGPFVRAVRCQLHPLVRTPASNCGGRG
jgi:hypothetical protein